MANNVTAAKPAQGGALKVGATTASLPTDVSGSLSGFTSLGSISEDGVTNDLSRESDEIRDWNGDVVMTTETSNTDTWKCTLIDGLDVNVLKEVFGADNVTGTLETGITVKANGKERVSRAWVLDMVMADGVLKRIVIPNGKISETGEVAYQNNQPVGYEITITAFPDASGNKHYEYMKAPGA